MILLWENGPLGYHFMWVLSRRGNGLVLFHSAKHKVTQKNNMPIIRGEFNLYRNVKQHITKPNHINIGLEICLFSFACSLRRKHFYNGLLHKLSPSHSPVQFPIHFDLLTKTDAGKEWQLWCITKDYDRSFYCVLWAVEGWAGGDVMWLKVKSCKGSPCWKM